MVLRISNFSKTMLESPKAMVLERKPITKKPPITLVSLKTNVLILKILCSPEPIGIQNLFQFVSRQLLNQNQRLLIFGK